MGEQAASSWQSDVNALFAEWIHLHAVFAMQSSAHADRPLAPCGCPINEHPPIPVPLAGPAGRSLHCSHGTACPTARTTSSAQVMARIAGKHTQWAVECESVMPRAVVHGVRGPLRAGFRGAVSLRAWPAVAAGGAGRRASLPRSRSCYGTHARSHARWGGDTIASERASDHNPAKSII